MLTAIPTRSRLLPLACLAVVAVLAFWGYLRTGPTTSDGLYYEQHVITGRLGELTTELATGSGRFHHYLHVGLTSLPYFLDSLPVRKALSLTVFLAAMASFCGIAARIAGPPGLGLLAFLFALAFYQDSWHHNILTSYPLVFDSGLLCIGWAAYCLWRFCRDGRRGFLAGAVALSFAACCHFEAFLAYAPVLWGVVWLTREAPVRTRLRTMAVSSLGFAAFLAITLAYRLAHPSQYSGNTLALHDPFAILKTIAVYSLTARPLGAFGLNLDYINRFPVATNALVLDWSHYLGQLAAHWSRVAPAWIALALATGGLTFHLLTRPGERPRWRPLAVLLAVYAIFCPNMLIALSPKYQEPAAGGLAWYVTSTFSGYAIALLLALGGLWLCRRLAGRPRARQVLAGALSLLAAGTALTTASINASVRESKVAAASRWRVASLAVAAPAFAAVPDGAWLVAPDLFQAVNEEKTRQGYWEDWFSHHAGKRLHVTAAAPASLPPGQPVFALRRLSGRTAPVTAVALARVTRLGPPNDDPYAGQPDAPVPLADRVDVAIDSGNRFFDLIFQDTASDGDPWRVVPANAVGRRGLAETTLAGEAIAVDSLALLPADRLTPRVATGVVLRFGQGFTPPERAITGDIVWSGPTGVVRLRNKTDRPVAARLSWRLIALTPVCLRLDGPGLSREIASAGPSTPVSLDLTLPPGDSRLTMRATPPGPDAAKRFGILGARLRPQP